MNILGQRHVGMRRALKRLLLTALALGMATAMLPLIASNGRADWTTPAHTGTITKICATTGANTVLAYYSAESQYAYMWTTPSSEAHPQFYSVLDADGACYSGATLIKISVSGTYPSGQPLEANMRFSTQGVYDGPEGSTQSALMLVHDAFTQLTNLDPSGVSQSLMNLAGSGNGCALGGDCSGVDTTTNTFYGEWSFGFPPPFFYSPKSLLFDWQLAVDPNQVGMYTLNVNYHLEIHNVNLYTACADGCPAIYTVDIPDQMLYCYVDCTQPSWNNARFVSQTAPPTTMYPGETTQVSVTMNNNGISYWYGPGGTCAGCPVDVLSSANPIGNMNWGVSSINMPIGFLGDGTYSDVTFKFVVTAPSAYGTYNFQWQMEQTGYSLSSPAVPPNWFGQLTPNVVVTVEPPDFSISSCSSLGLSTSSSGSCSISVTSLAGWTGSVNFKTTVSSSAISASQPPSVTISTGWGTASSSVTVSSGSTTGTFQVTITATDATGAHTHTWVISVTVTAPSSGGGGGGGGCCRPTACCI